ncbi:MAG: hypothetical protein LBT31_05255 [Synergistaceae bacterium]|jgi:hypothetical protein|nr:hypothetical protein [Synergistaceae bacterium]
MEERKCNLCGGTIRLSPKGDYEECANCGIRVKVVKEKKRPGPAQADNERETSKSRRQLEVSASDFGLAEIGVVFTQHTPSPDPGAPSDVQYAASDPDPDLDQTPEAAPAAAGKSDYAYTPPAPQDHSVSSYAQYGVSLSGVTENSSGGEQTPAPDQNAAAPALVQQVAPSVEESAHSGEHVTLPQPAPLDQQPAVEADYGQYGELPSQSAALDIDYDLKSAPEPEEAVPASTGENVAALSAEGNKILDETMRKGMALMAEGKMQGAYAIFDGVIKEYPEDHRGWWGLLLYYTRNLSGFFSTAAKFAFDRACDLADTKSMDEIVDRYHYGRDTHRRKIAFLKDGLHKRMMTLDLSGETNLSYIYYKSEKIADENGDKRHHFMLYRNGLTNYMEETLKPEGPKREEYASESPLDENGIFTTTTKGSGRELKRSFWIEFISDDYSELHLCDPYYCSDYDGSTVAPSEPASNVEDQANGYVIIAKAELRSLDEKKEDKKESADITSRNRQLQEQRVEWRRKGFCQHCGGAFSRFFKKCRNCGRQKDY